MDLLKAVKEGNLADVKQILADNPDGIKECEKVGNSVLHVAISKNHMDCFNELIENGADVNALDGDKRTPLHLAAAHEGENAMVFMSQLVHQGAKVYTTDACSLTPLLQACVTGHLEAVKFLLEQKASIDARDDLGRDALAIAACAGFPWDKGVDNSAIITLLVEDYGCDPSKVCQDGMTPLMFAAERDSVESIRCLLKYNAGVNKVNQKGESALYLVVKNHLLSDADLEGIELLCKHGADLNCEVSGFLTPATPLVDASQRGDIKIMKILLRNGSGFHSQLNDLIGGDHVNHPEEFYCNRLLVVGGVYVKTPWKHDFVEYHDVWCRAQTHYVNNRDVDNREFYSYPDNSSSKSRTANADRNAHHISLRKLCRYTIRCHLLAMKPDRNLFCLVPKLAPYIPKLMQQFILFDFDIDAEDDF